MTKAELRERLKAGEKLDDLLTFTSGQECDIFKADKFLVGQEVIYIPDIYLNFIPTTRRVRDAEELEEILAECFTGDDFLDQCDGNMEMAERLFCYCDWQHPSSARDEIDDEEEQE